MLFGTRETTYIKIYFVRLSDSGLTAVYEVVAPNSGYDLGMIKWYAPWRRYIFHSRTDRSFDHGSLLFIGKFLEQLMSDHWKTKNNRTKAPNN